MTFILILIFFIIGYFLIKYWIKIVNLIFRPIENNLEKIQENLKSVKNQSQKENTEETSKSNLGKFDLNDFPIQDRNKSFYLNEYKRPDGEWIEIDEPICNIRIGEMNEFAYKSATVTTSESGVLEHTLAEGDVITSGQLYYKLHKKGDYKNENSIENSEYKEFFKGINFKQAFKKWLITDGSFVKSGDPIFQFSGGAVNYSKKSGFIHQIHPTEISTFNNNELIYIIRNIDEIRQDERYINKPNIIKDEFTNSTIIEWDKVSSKSINSAGIKMKSDNFITDFLFSFNYINSNDNIVFHFNPKQIKPKRFDKVFFLFENGEQIQYEFIENPVSFKNRLNQKILRYKSLITKTELELFANSNLIKWKISLVSDKREIFGGEIGGDDFYQTKNNLQIVIKKFAKEYIDLINNTISNYETTIFKQTEPELKSTSDFCFVYLMQDTSNNYYKIGISNNPEYREKTLQSEKPTIEIITSKKFPVRNIAESIEKALHSNYSEKRLRGEWFKLNASDVDHIKETLK